MLNRRYHLHGLFVVLLALVMQLAVGASMPCLSLIGEVTEAEAPCHETHDTGGAPTKVPVHPADCLACSLCCAMQPPISLVPVPPNLTPPRIQHAHRTELPPPARAPPPPRSWSPSQPRAPPSVS